MPAKHSIKQYVKGGYYHIYNRGVDKRTIFLDKKDYSVFLRFLKEYLLPPNHPSLLKLQGTNPRRHPINCHMDISLLAYCLMPNHFHLLIRQKTKEGMKSFMKAIATNYSMYFNRRYKRTGHLFQGRYKASLITKENYYLHITRYIHRNPLKLLKKNQSLEQYSYSSYHYYLLGNPPQWLNTKPILDLFRSAKNKFPKDILSYQSFVEQLDINSKEILGDLAFD
jgi:putative transposase